MKGNLNIVKELIKYGANVNFLNKDGWNSLHLAAKEGKKNDLDLFNKENSSNFHYPFLL